jgi:thioredoxin 1
MATKNLTAADFEVLEHAPGITVVDFWADWCAPCHQFAPVFERVSEKHPDITFGKVDTEAEIDLAARLGIMAMPTVMVIRDGVVVYQEPGALPERLMETLIAKVRELDAEKLRAQADAA